jgi:hypothetical protein
MLRFGKDPAAGGAAASLATCGSELGDAASAGKRVPDMKQLAVLAVCGLSLSACSGISGWFNKPKPAPAATTMQFESEPAGAEARISDGQNCRTPCSLAVTAGEFTVTFSMAGREPQTVPVRMVPAPDPSEAPRLVPNPVFVELQPTAPPPRVRRPAPAPSKPRPAQRPAPSAMAPQPAAPAPAPASPWPPPPPPSR